MKLISDEAQKIVDRYLRKLDRAIDMLPAEKQTDIRNEISAHIADSMAASKKQTELERLLDALDRLGDPETFMKPMIADYRIEIATSSFNPNHLVRALAANIGAGVNRTLRYTVFSMLYLTLFSFVFLLLAKVCFPSNTGLFVYQNEFKGFGYMANATVYTEILGFWIYPILIIGCFLEYMAITLLMRVTRIRKK